MAILPDVSKSNGKASTADLLAQIAALEEGECQAQGGEECQAEHEGQ